MKEKKTISKELNIVNFQGLIISELWSGEMENERRQLISIILELLPQNKPRMISCNGLAKQMLDLVEQGLDFLYSNICNELTDQNVATIFPINLEKNPSNLEKASILNIQDSTNVVNTFPLLFHCKCYTCLKHEISYIHHLIHSTEMLGYTLIQLHNVYHFIYFFNIIRKKINEKIYLIFKKCWKNRTKHSLCK